LDPGQRRAAGAFVTALARFSNLLSPRNTQNAPKEIRAEWSYMRFRVFSCV
jgi:hypothetical protein